MRAFNASDLLTVWERGTNSPPGERALMLLLAAFPDAPPAALAHLTIGQRDLVLIKLREMTFGSKLAGIAVCPDCGEKVEMDFDSRDIAASGASLPDFQNKDGAGITLSLPGWELRFRLPTSADLASLPAEVSQAKAKLLETCVLEASHEGKAVQAANLPEEVVVALSESMAKEDPYANIVIAPKCPACGHEWQMIFDILGYFMSEINVWAARMTREVHRLASAYGWPEADILAMSAFRRQRYLELIGGS